MLVIIQRDIKCFLIGPRRQCHKMFHPTRRVACIIYLVLLITVFALAMAKAPVGVIIPLMIVQLCAATWYAASYIPYGRAMITNFFKSCLKCKE